MSGSNSPAPPPRLVPDAPLPPYSYVTGRYPHPTRDPAGHSFGHPVPQSRSIVGEAWGALREYLLGCDLFNRGYYWEAHEAWEAVWQANRAQAITADFIKGLIKLAAAGVKMREGRTAGVARHAARAAQLFEEVHAQVAGPRYMGFDLEGLAMIARNLPSHRYTKDDTPAGASFDFFLLPE